MANATSKPVDVGTSGIWKCDLDDHQAQERLFLPTVLDVHLLDFSHSSELSTYKYNCWVYGVGRSQRKH